MKRNKHSLSSFRIVSCDMGKLIPVGVTEVLPGDTFQQQTSALIRVSPLVAPVMHPIQVRIHHWFVPNRLIWTGWEDFITGVSTPTYPTVTVPATPEGKLLDYLGVANVASVVVSALPVRCYNMIYNEFYRDQDLVTEVGEDDLNLLRVAWEKDYFAGARPWAVKGTPVTLPLGTKAPIKGIGNQGQTYSTGPLTVFETGETASSSFAKYDDMSVAGNFVGEEDPDNAGFPGIFADLSASSAIPINEFRKAFALQRYQEARARYGSRYTEYLRYLGVRSSDSRLQRPEYLGGGRQTIAFSEVLQTAEGTTTPVGKLLGHGIAALRSRRYRRFFEEHGHVLTLMSVRPKAMYVQANHKKWLRRTKEDYYQKELETIGQQEIYRGEIFAEVDPGDGTGGGVTFGYADRYREYREEPSMVCGEFRSTLDYWHLARDLASAPTLNQSFIECNPSKRIHADQTNHQLWCMVAHSLQARRMVNKSAVARMI